jgi:hypothetical protein
MLGDEADQAFAAARNRQVDDVAELQQLHHRLAAQVLDQRDRRRASQAPKAARSAEAIARLLSNASEPPRSNTALPA